MVMLQSTSGANQVIHTPIVGTDSEIGMACGQLANRLQAFLGCLLVCALLTSCAVMEKPAAPSKPAPVTERSIEKSPKAPEKVQVIPKRLPRVTILMSDDIPAYRGVRDELIARLPHSPSVINLQGEPVTEREIIEKLEQAGNRHVVAIGPLAAQAASQYTAGMVLFCQVFNHTDLGLTAPHLQGVSMLPPADLHFRAWVSHAPGLQRVGVITGNGHEALFAKARDAARSHGIELKHRVVKSDREMLHAFKRLTPQIQGLWLLPDDRVLSRRVLRDIMAYSVKHNLQVVVFHPELLRHGALMSVSSVDSDVAVQVIAALRNIPDRTGSPAGTLRPLSKIHIELNPLLEQEHGRLPAPQSRVVADAP